MTRQSLDTKSTYIYLLSITHSLTGQVHILSGTTSINISTQNTVCSVTASEMRGKMC